MTKKQVLVSQEMDELIVQYYKAKSNDLKELIELKRLELNQLFSKKKK